MPRALPTGIARVVRKGQWVGYRVFVWINPHDPRWPKGRIQSRRFPRETPLETMKQWREAQRVDARRAIPKPQIVRTGFLADAAIYLQAVAAMPTHAERCREIRAWVEVFGNTPRSSITPTLIRTMRDRWLTVGPKRVQVKREGRCVWEEQPIPLAASSVNLRLRALENLYTVLDGRRAYNPVREVPEADPPDLSPRAIPRDVVAAIIAALPDTGRPANGKRPEDSLTKARLSVMAETGLSHSQLARVEPGDLNIAGATLYMRPRHKGTRSRVGRGQTVPLTPAAANAFKYFVALNAWGRFSRSSMRRSFRVACAKLGLPPTLRVYDIRHGFGSQLYAASGDIDATAIMMGHRDVRTTRRYTMAAVDPRLQYAVDQMAAAVGEVGGKVMQAGKASRDVTQNRPTVRKP